MLTFREPDGSEVKDPSEDFLRQRVVEGDLDYWSGPAGDAWLLRQQDGEDADLVLTVQAEGVLVQHRDNLTGELRWVAGEPGDGERVPFFDGQETWELGRRFLVPRPAAFEAVAEFARTGRPAPGLRWESELDLSEEPI
jgi:hypothetical protein